MLPRIMNFDPTPKVAELSARIAEFMDEQVYPNEANYFDYLANADSRWVIPPVIETLKSKARAAGLWNLFLPDSDDGAGLTNLEYAPLVNAETCRDTRSDPCCAERCLWHGARCALR